MIVVTGAAGFIGSGLVKRLNMDGHYKNVIVVDDFYKSYKDENLDNKFIRDWIHRDIFLPWFRKLNHRVDFVFHLGARTDTASEDTAVFDRLNVEYSKAIWEICTENNIPLVYASSAATYGVGENGYDDDHAIIPNLKPLNSYARSKQTFDIWVLEQEKTPPFWAGLKFFNVYGPNEYHKKRMASVPFNAYFQIRKTRGMNLFRSHREDIKDGMQKRDFIYVKDVVEVCRFFYENQHQSGIYNVGTGQARSFLDLANALFHSMNLDPHISFIDTPEDIRDNYQYFTEAKIDKLRAAGYDKPFMTLEEGIEDYVSSHLSKRAIW